MRDFTSPFSFMIDSPALTEARRQEQAAMDAEYDARNRRLDRDRIISAALDCLVDHARHHALDGQDSRQRDAYLVGYTGVTSTRDVLSLIDDIRNGLSPLTR